jgi:LacI family transcriptional regulator
MAVNQGRSAHCGRADAILCGSDQIARGIVDALGERGVNVPEDIALSSASIIGQSSRQKRARRSRPSL